MATVDGRGKLVKAGQVVMLLGQGQILADVTEVSELAVNGERKLHLHSVLVLPPGNAQIGNLFVLEEPAPGPELVKQ